MITLNEFDWEAGTHRATGNITEIVQESETEVICRYYTHTMVLDDDKPYMMPLVKLKKLKAGWRAYFLKDLESAVPEFETRGIHCTPYYK